jgi:iron only hydrogenase large subunit-like protein
LKTKPTIHTLDANCQDCYRCVRACPVKAIRVTGGHARIRDEYCVRCGTCVKECPQRSKRIRSDLDEVKAILSSGSFCACSVAPSFAALLDPDRAFRLPSALRSLGFDYVSETAEGAEYVTEKSFAAGTKGSLCTCCPVVVNYVEMYKPSFLGELVPVVSPMVAHGRLLKEARDDCAVVFVGPCAAKKDEARRPENLGAVDAVLTFGELFEWFEEAGINLENCIESGFDSVYPVKNARLFPLEGGMLKTGNLAIDPADASVMALTGPANVISYIESANRETGGKRVESMFCPGGCADGPGFPSNDTPHQRKTKLIAYNIRAGNAGKEALRVSGGDGPDLPATDIDHAAVFTDKKVLPEAVSESEVDRILEKMGKSESIARLNCGACGYKSCVEHAEAVARGMAEPDMCIPYVRTLAQQRTDRIIETTPNGVVILDGELSMIKMNPAFQKMFMCNNGILGRRISYLLNSEGFEKLQAGNTELYEAIRSKYGVRYHEILYPLREEGQYVGIYADISKIKYDAKQLDVIKAQTIVQAKEFLDHQVRFAQEMAHYLGKSTAKSEELAKQLINLYDENDSPQE